MTAFAKTYRCSTPTVSSAKLSKSALAKPRAFAHRSNCKVSAILQDSRQSGVVSGNQMTYVDRNTKIKR